MTEANTMFDENGQLTPRAQFIVDESARRAAEIAIRDMLLTLGIDTDRRLETQENFAAIRQVVREHSDPMHDLDMAYLRNLRVSSESMRARGILAFVGVLMTFAGGLIALGLKAWVGGAGLPGGG